MADAVQETIGIPDAGTSIIWGVVLSGILVLWYRAEGTLSIHSVTTQRRELSGWSTMIATFAPGAAVGDSTATALGLGHLSSGIVFTVLA